MSTGTWMRANDAAKALGIKGSALRQRARNGTIDRKDGAYFVEAPAFHEPEKFHAHGTAPVVAGRQQAPVAERPSSLAGAIASVPKAPAAPLEKWILIPDTHVPYQNTAHFALVLRAAQSIGATNVVVLGDFADCYAVSRFPKDPQRRLDLQWEIDEVNAALDILDATFTGIKKITLGNHEKRMERFIVERAPELSAMMKIDEMLRLKERGWLVTDYMDHTTVGKLNCTHEVGNAGPNAHRQAQATFNDNVVIGHTHRLAWEVVGSVVGKPHVCAMLGWLGDVSKIDYQHRAKVAKTSAQGFGVAYVEADGCVHLHPVAIVNGRCVLEGRLIT